MLERFLQAHSEHSFSRLPSILCVFLNTTSLPLSTLRGAQLCASEYTTVYVLFRFCDISELGTLIAFVKSRKVYVYTLRILRSIRNHCIDGDL